MTVPAKILNLATIEKPAYDWPESEPLTPQTTAAPYPMDALPGIIGGAVSEVAKIVKCPVALAANSALSVLATACQGVADIQFHAELEPSPLSLNLMAINDSGERKTTADKKFSKVLKAWCAAKTAGLEDEVKAYEAELKSWNAQMVGLEKAITEASKKGNHEQVENASKQLVILKQSEPKKVYTPDMVSSRATPQAIIDALKDWPSVGILTAEAGSFFGGHGMKSENLTGSLALFNVLWDGDGAEDRTRGNGKISLPGSRLTVGLAIQDAVIRDFHEKNGKTSRGSGFFARYLIAAPASTMGTRFITVEEAKGGGRRNNSQLNLFHAKLNEMLEQQYTNGKDGRFDNLPVLQLSDDALTYWVSYYNDVEKELKIGGTMEEAKDTASKSAENAARLAGLFHLFNGGNVLDLITGETMKAACKLAGWYLYEARRFFGEIALPAEDLEAVKLDAWLIAECKKNGGNAVDKSRIRQCVTPARLRDIGKINKALDTLERANRVRQTKEGRTAVIEINPALLEGGK